MNKDIQVLLEQVQSTADFGYVSFDSINDTNELGDNALHCVCVWGDLEAAKLLVENSININQRGEGGFTPLNVALDFGYQELAEYLITNGADTSVIGAKEVFDRERHHLHMLRLSEEIEALEEKIEHECDGTRQQDN